jgi:glycosyltransferase involved in cell wall biosynthesis
VKRYRMRIAQVAPLYESVPPRGYGGTERVVSYLTEELVRLGHEVTLFATADSVTKARLIPGWHKGMRLDPDVREGLPGHLLMLEELRRRSHEFDIVHFHLDYLHFALSRLAGITQLTTLHGRLDMPELKPLYREFSDMPVVSISDNQRRPLPFANWLGTVYHGMPEDLHTFREQSEGYLAFLGRISPEKRPDRAIEIATRAGRKLRIMAKVDPVDAAYFAEVIEPLLAHPLVEYVGEGGGAEKDEFLGKADALLFPIDWPEPFGMVLIEAMACGTPVIAFPHGSVPEVLDDGVTGWLVDTVDEAVAAVDRIAELDRRRIRERFEDSFSVTRMATEYLRIYEVLREERDSQRGLLPRLAYPAA